MIDGVGIDMIEVDRIAASLGKGSGFRELVFSPGEINYCEPKTNKYEHYAARFAAKEAFYKALGEGWMANTAFNEIELTHDDKGKPVINLLGNTRQFLSSMGIRKIHVSLSHLKAIASAVVIIEK
jgi:holo-[acyl-carrier protein] synthase